MSSINLHNDGNKPILYKVFNFVIVKIYLGRGNQMVDQGVNPIKNNCSLLRRYQFLGHLRKYICNYKEISSIGLTPGLWKRQRNYEIICVTSKVFS